MVIDGFDWDAGNREKCQKHGVSLAEIEALFSSVVSVFPDPGHSTKETRLRAIGRAAQGRYIFIAFTLRNRNGAQLVRPINARYMHVKEIRHYEAQIAQATRPEE